MRIGIPTEVKAKEGRVALVPEACRELVQRGHTVLVQQGAGEASGYPDEMYARAGAKLVDTAASLYGEAQLVVKVKEPVAADLAYLRADHLLFCFLHLAPNPELTQKLLQIGLTAVAFETVEVAGQLPLLAPMSHIAGRIAVQVGAHLLHQPAGGSGILLGGIGGTPRGRVVVIGAGEAGSRSVEVAAGLGAEVTVFDLKMSRLDALRRLGNNITTLYPYRDALEKAIRRADMLVGAVLVPGAKAPHVVSREMVCSMRPGSVIADISIDQGGCVETIRPTDYDAPTFTECGVTHFGVTNMPGAVPRTASQALSAVILPHVLKLAGGQWRDDPALQAGVNLSEGELIHPALKV